MRRPAFPPPDRPDASAPGAVLLALCTWLAVLLAGLAGLGGPAGALSQTLASKLPVQTQPLQRLQGAGAASVRAAARHAAAATATAGTPAAEAQAAAGSTATARAKATPRDGLPAWPAELLALVAAPRPLPLAAVPAGPAWQSVPAPARSAHALHMHPPGRAPPATA